MYHRTETHDCDNTSLKSKVNRKRRERAYAHVQLAHTPRVPVAVRVRAFCDLDAGAACPSGGAPHRAKAATGMATMTGLAPLADEYGQ